MSNNKKVFQEGGHYFEVSHIGWGDTSMQFHGYIEGYKSAADNIIESALASQDIATLDTFFFPVCFLYRQYLELQMKSIILEYSSLSRLEKQALIKQIEHGLLSAWEQAKTVLMEDENFRKWDKIGVVEEYLEEFHLMDASSFTFRYPISKNLQGVWSGPKHINLVVLKERMQELYEFFDSCRAGLSVIADIKQEMEDYYSFE